MDIWKAITARYLRARRTAEDIEAHRVLSEIVRDFETGPGGVLERPAHEPCGFERARGVLRSFSPYCRVVGHAPDCECAIL